MERLAMQDLIRWKNDRNRKPLIIHGARQVGKTWLIKEFGKKEYEQTVYINFESSKALQSLFTTDFNIERIITAIQIESGKTINPENTLILFDEIQEAEGGLTALKYFYENAQSYHIIAAGSLLGLSLHTSVSFPVGKVEFLELYPLNFSEFLLAIEEKPMLQLLESQDWELIKTFKEKLIRLLRHYYFIGGMPEVVLSFRTKKDFALARKLQKQILLAYEQDFSKHAPKEIVPRIRMIWDSIPAQLAKENKKFIYGFIKKGSRAKDYELGLAWLINTGLIYKVERISKPGIPLKSYADNNAFKIYILDVGLLSAICDISAKTLLDGNNIFTEFKGILSEQYALQQIISKPGSSVFYWSAENSQAEIDFIIQHSDQVVPIEVKAENNLQAKSLKSFHQKYSPKQSVRTSMADYKKEDWLINVPLYSINYLNNILDK